MVSKTGNVYKNFILEADLEISALWVPSLAPYIEQSFINESPSNANP